MFVPPHGPWIMVVLTTTIGRNLPPLNEPANPRNERFSLQQYLRALHRLLKTSWNMINYSDWEIEPPPCSSVRMPSLPIGSTHTSSRIIAPNQFFIATGIPTVFFFFFFFPSVTTPRKAVILNRVTKRNQERHDGQGGKSNSDASSQHIASHKTWGIHPNKVKAGLSYYLRQAY